MAEDGLGRQTLQRRFGNSSRAACAMCNRRELGLTRGRDCARAIQHTATNRRSFTRPVGAADPRTPLQVSTVVSGRLRNPPRRALWPCRCQPTAACRPANRTGLETRAGRGGLDILSVAKAFWQQLGSVVANRLGHRNGLGQNKGTRLDACSVDLGHDAPPERIPLADGVV